MKRYVSPESCPQVADLLALAEDHASAREYERANDLHARALEVLFELGSGPGLAEERAQLRNLRAQHFLYLGLWEQALGELDRVLALREDLADPALVIRAQVMRAQAHGAYGEYEEALGILRGTLPLAEALGDPVEQARVHGLLGALLARIGEHEAGGESLQRALDLLPEPLADAESGILRATALSQLGLAAFRQRQGEQAREYYQKSLEILGRWGSESEAESETWRFLGVLWSVRGRFGVALRHLRRALRGYLRNRMPLGRARVYNSLGQACLEMGRLDDALLFLGKAEQICLELGAEAELAAVYGKLGAVHLHRGDYARAVELHRRDVELSRRFGSLRTLAFAIRNLGLSLRASGDLGEAGRCLQEALESFQKLQDQGFAMQVKMDLAEVWLDWGRLPEADQCLRRAWELLRADSPDLDRARLWILRGTLERLRQRWEEAHEAYLEALRLLSDVGPTASLAQVRYELGALHAESRDVEQAVYHLRECLALARPLGAAHLADKAMRLLDSLDEVEVVDLLLEDLEVPGEFAPESGLSEPFAWL